MNTKALDKKYLARSSNEEIEIVKSKDSLLIDATGKQYIDFFSGWCVGNFGWSNADIKKAIINSKSPAYVFPNFLYKPWTQLAELLISLAPSNLEKCFRATGGTEAVDGALQIAMLYTKRKKFISIEGAYHGNSIATLSIGENKKKKKLKNVLLDCHKIDTSLDMKALKRIETLLSKKEYAAFIMEPIICNLGVVIPDYGFMQSLQKLCKKYGTLLIMDEVATGFGRTGKVFACEHFGLHPDMMTLGKALSGGYAAIGAILTTKEIADAVQEDVSLHSTYGWHPLSVDAALATVKYLKKNKKAILSNVNEMNSYFLDRLYKMNFKKLKQINSMGLAFGIKVGDSKYAEQISNKCKKNGLLVIADEDLLMLLPALTIDLKTASRGLDILEKSL